jgi:hypothetical protein
LIDGGKSDLSVLNKIMGDNIVLSFSSLNKVSNLILNVTVITQEAGIFSDCLKGEGNVESSLQWTVHLSP